MNKKHEEIQEFFKSKQLVINERFLVKISILNTGAFKKSILLVVKDLVESNFKMQFYNDEDAAMSFLETLRQI